MFDVKGFISKHKATLSADPTELQQLEQTIDELQQGYMRQQDYNRKSNERDEAYRARVAAEDAYHKQLADAEQELIRQREELRRNGGDPVTQSEILKLQSTVNSLTEAMQTQQQAFQQSLVRSTQVALKIPEFSRKYEKKYGKDFDVVEFDQFLGNNPGVTDLELAFRLYTADDEKKLSETDFQKQLDAAREEGRREAAARGGRFPEESTGGHRSPLSIVRPAVPAQVPAQPANTPYTPAAAAATNPVPEAGSAEARQRVNDSFSRAMSQG